jgi:hypothetical protein
MLSYIGAAALAAIGITAGFLGHREIRRQEQAPDIWLYHLQAIIPGAGPWTVLVSHKGHPSTPMPEKGWRFVAIPGTYISHEGAEKGAIKYIKERGGTPELFT